MPIPNGCTMTNGAFSTGFSAGFNVVVLFCGPYYRDAQDEYAPGADAAQVSLQPACADIFANTEAEDERQ